MPESLILPLLVLFLLPCALQDHRSRRVSNWLTQPAFFAAWPLALWLGGEERLLFTFAVFAGCWLAWGMKSMGAADGKLATIIAGVSPMALGVGVLLLVMGRDCAYTGGTRSFPPTDKRYQGGKNWGNNPRRHIIRECA